MLIAVLDADVLFPMVLRDTLLRAAAAGCFRLHWSSRIRDEVTRNLIDPYGMEGAKAIALWALMEEVFPEAEVGGWEALEPTMRNHPKDRHVAAAAATIGAQIIVTSNIRDFADLPAGVEAMTPDQFLSVLLETAPVALISALRVQAAGYRRPPMSAAELVQQLAALAPTFSAAAARAIKGEGAPAVSARKTN